MYRLPMLIGLFLSISLTYACMAKKTSNATTDHGIEVEYPNLFQLEKGWDIYDGGGYRYGPSIMVDDDGTIHAWFAAPGGIHGMDQLHFNEEHAEVPVPIRGNSVVAQQFHSDQDFYGLAVRCPNWNSDASSISLSIFKWNKDYATSLSSAPIITKRFHHYIDNQNVILNSDRKFSAGDYLWVLDAPEGTAGVWAREGTYAGVQSYVNGKSIDQVFESFLMFNQSNAETYWDQVAYKKSNDQGKTWTPEKMVLKPTEGTRDQFSICDPAVVKIGKYYYLGYTSTEDIRMIFNHAYIARSLSVVGPWEKWDGKDWGTHPQPIVTFTGDKDAWGAGEPSMVVRNDSLFFYYTWRDKDKHETRVAVADAKLENWPATLQYQGIAVNQTNIKSADHADVKYRPDLKKFQLIHTASRFQENSRLMLWESVDGLHFQKVADIKEFSAPYLHNCGWSGDALGHQDPNKPQYVAYAYGQDWGNWKTSWHHIIYVKK